MFEDKWIQKWEATLNRDWTMVRDIWVKKYGEVTRATMMAAKCGSYESAAALRARRAHTPPPAPPAAPTAEYDALVEYAMALEAENLELKSVGGRVTFQNSATSPTLPLAQPPQTPPLH